MAGASQHQGFKFRIKPQCKKRLSRNILTSIWGLVQARVERRFCPLVTGVPDLATSRSEILVFQTAEEAVRGLLVFRTTPGGDEYDYSPLGRVVLAAHELTSNRV